MDLKDQHDLREIICRPFITLKNGQKLWAYEKGLKAFCFPASPGYQEKQEQKKEPAIKQTQSKTK